MISIAIENFPEVDKQLAQLPLELRATALRAGLNAAGQVVINRAKELVPKPGYPGDKPEYKPLRDTIGKLVKVYGDIWVAIVGPQRPAGAHGHLVERGTKPHEIIASAYVSSVPTSRGARRAETVARYASRQRKKALAADVASDDQMYGRRVKHPGGKATPFMEPASKDTQAQQQSAIIAAIGRAIDRVTRKAA